MDEIQLFDIDEIQFYDRRIQLFDMEDVADQKKLRPYSSAPQANCHSDTISIIAKCATFWAGRHHSYVEMCHFLGMGEKVVQIF